MKLTLALITALLLAPLAALHAADTKPAKPNFVVILIEPDPFFPPTDKRPSESFNEPT